MYLRHDIYFLSNYSQNPYWYLCRIYLQAGEEIPISPFSPLVQEVDDEGTERRQALSYPQLTKLVWTVLELVETLLTLSLLPPPLGVVCPIYDKTLSKKLCETRTLLWLSTTTKEFRK